MDNIASKVFRMAAGIEYDGAPFFGWQHQPNLPTVQGALYQALQQLIGGGEQSSILKPSNLVVAGRTDRGVHARQQVIHIDLPHHLSDRPSHSWMRGFNTLLPKTIKVLWTQTVDPSFDARRSAIGRHYRYFLLHRSVKPAIGAGKVGWTWRSLNIEAMQQATEALIGTHDFTSFRASNCQAKSPVRTLRNIDMFEYGNILTIHFHANGFLHHMIRNIVGSLIEIGCQRKPIDWLADLLQRRDRCDAAMTFMPDGLYLWHIDYPPGVLNESSTLPWTDSTAPNASWEVLPVHLSL